MGGEHNQMIYDECDSDVKPTTPPTQSSQDDNTYGVKTEVGRSSSYKTGDEPYRMNDGMNVKTNDECELVSKKTWCKKHNCLVNKVTITSKKWQWIRSRKCYGNVSSKVSKYLCKSKKPGRVVPPVSPTRSNHADKIQGIENEEGGRGSSYVVRHVASNMSERESKLADGDVYS